MPDAKWIIEQVVNGTDPAKLVNEAKVVDVYFIKATFKALQNQTQSMIRAGANIPKNYDKKLFDKGTAHLAEAISVFDEWIEQYDRVTKSLKAPGK